MGCNQTVCTIRAQYDVSARPWDPLCSTSEPAAQAPKQGTAYDPGQHRACTNTPPQCGLIAIISYGNGNDNDKDNGNHRSICQYVFDKHPRRRRTWCPCSPIRQTPHLRRVLPNGARQFETPRQRHLGRASPGSNESNDHAHIGSRRGVRLYRG